ncbi:hypothetical protein Q4566_00015 [Tamlana sp. 2_MG-2023]|uniref:toxin-antitoxin system YwqK family antitoxin n=1 Tax=unclassified Tamlana TaxID=2614803 RepID=UPI0026E2BAD5|nr:MULTISPECIES: hypothetical protein [unclassified Tamlana]MDO6758565.1 hypothetical protein [Tamlana sp. 2_MG-2023]MDO6789264.1 hypothetical protein [Tamlana sp. 1_MG-2023]
MQQVSLLKKLITGMVENYRITLVQKSFYVVAILIGLVSCKSSNEPFTKIITSDTEFKEHFFISDYEPKPRRDKRYYWFKSQKVHSSQGDYGGALLDGVYQKYYYTNELAEKGDFIKGIKTGIWNSWYKNGQIVTSEKWVNGKLSGKSVFYDSIGKIICEGKYRNGLRSGKWIYPIKGVTVKYKKGEKVIKTKDTTKTRFFNRLFAKKENGDKKGDKNKNKVGKSSVKNSSKKEVKKSRKKQSKQKKEFDKAPNFFQRLFVKKDKD